MAYAQGALDGLCGPYSVINALTAAAGLQRVKKTDAEKMFGCLMQGLHAKGLMPAALYEGTNVTTLMALIRGVQDEVVKRIGAPIEAKYATRRKMPLNAYWELLQAHLAQPGTAAVVGVWGIYDHWTCVTDASPRALRLMDSDDMPLWLPRFRTTVGDPTKSRPYAVCPTETILLRYPPAS